MSKAPQLRRTDKAMTKERADDVIQRGVCGRLATVSADGSPYVVPLLYIRKKPVIYFHTSAVRGHLRQNIDGDARACFEIDEAGQMKKYAPNINGRPKSFYPRLHHIDVFALTVERLTGKETPLPSVSQQWPALDQARTPDAVPPSS